MFQSLLNFWLFPIFGMFLAAGATIGDVGIGGGDGGSDGGANGDASTGEVPSDGDGGASAGENESGDESLSDGESEGQSESDQLDDPDVPVDLGNGRTVPGKWKKLFDQAQKAGLGKEVKQLYFANQRLAKAIPGGVNGAIQLAKDIEEMGGVEGIQQLQADSQTHAADAELFENNQGKWVENAFQENPDAALKAFDHSLTYVAEKHIAHYDYRAAGIIIADLNNLDIRAIHGLLAAQKDNPEAQKKAKELADYYNSRLETSKQVPERKPDAQSKALTEREKSVETRETNTRYADVNRDAFPALKATVTKNLQAQAKVAGIDLVKLSKEYPGEWRDLLNDIHQRIMRAATKDSRFINNYVNLIKKNDLKRALKAINDKHDSLAAEAVRESVAERGLFRGKKKSAEKGASGAEKPNAQAAQNQGWNRVAKRPEQSSINFAKTTGDMQVDGKYILKDGRKVVVVY